jgi:hypothetical protein
LNLKIDCYSLATRTPSPFDKNNPAFKGALVSHVAIAGKDVSASVILMLVFAAVDIFATVGR